MEGLKVDAPMGITKDGRPSTTFNSGGFWKVWKVCTRYARLRTRVNANAVDHPQPSNPPHPPAITPFAADLTWLCGSCGQPVGDWDGYLYVSPLDAMARERVSRQREATHAGRAVSIGELVREWAEDPGIAAWRVTHHRCDSRPDFADGYHIDPGRIATWSQLAHWTAHLMDKRWFAHTDWDELLREAAGDTPPFRVCVAGRAG